MKRKVLLGVVAFVLFSQSSCSLLSSDAVSEQVEQEVASIAAQQNFTAKQSVQPPGSPIIPAEQEGEHSSANEAMLQSQTARGQGIVYALDDCIAIAFNNNADLRAQALAIEQKENEVYASWGDFLPTLGVNYDIYDYNSDAKQEQRGTNYSYDTKSLLFSINQPIFSSFSGVNGLRRTLMEQHSAEKNLQYTQMRLINHVRSAYYNKLFAVNLRRNYEQSISRLLSQLKIATAWVEQRLAPPLRALEVKTRLAHARHQLIHAQSQEAIALSQLRSAMMLPTDSILSFSDEITTVVSPLCSTLEQCRTQARNNRPELAMGALAIDTAQMDAKIAISRNLPAVNLEGRWSDGERNNDDPVETSFGSLTTEDEDYYSLMLTMTFRPFQGGRNYFTWKALRKRVKALREKLRQQYHNIDNEVETRWLLYQESIAAMEPAQEAVKEAKLAYDMNKKFVKLGVVSLDEVLDAEIELTQAQNSLYSAQLSLRLAEVNLALASAELP